MRNKLHQVKQFFRHQWQASSKGHGVHSPFAYSLCEEVFYNDQTFYDFEKLNNLRRRLLIDHSLIEVKDLGAGSSNFTGSHRKISDIAAKGISTRKQSEVLYKLRNYLNIRTIIELGTSVGLNTLYLAISDKETKVITIEGSPALSGFAKSLADANEIRNIEFITSSFDEAFIPALEKIKAVDFLYVDGNHRYEPTVKYFKQALPYSHNRSVFIFDDIYWSPEMTNAWQEIIQHPSVTMSIDAFYFGIVFFREEIKQPVHLKIKI